MAKLHPAHVGLAGSSAQIADIPGRLGEQGKATQSDPLKQLRPAGAIRGKKSRLRRPGLRGFRMIACSRRQGMGETRKLVAILAADVVGYSRLMGEDEAGTARAVREHREAAAPIVARLGGRLVKTMGDGILLEFPSIVAAVECAIAIQKQMGERNAALPEAKRILYRMGVNLGDVLIDGEDILGEGVNIAARLEEIAEPGGICISGTARDHVRGRIDAEFVDLGEKALKNIAPAVRTFAIQPGSTGVASTRRSAAPEIAGPPRLSIVVLPFAQIGGDVEQEYFVDGVTESSDD